MLDSFTGMIDKFTGEYRWLSNFWLEPVEMDGVVYPSVEHAYQAAKTLDPEIRKEFAKSTVTPGQAKKMGRSIANQRPDWHKVSIGIMWDLVRKKFKNKELAKLLLDTGDKHIVEGNTWGDEFWGVCDGKGQNYLGKILMNVREEILLNTPD